MSKKRVTPYLKATEERWSHTESVFVSWYDTRGYYYSDWVRLMFSDCGAAPTLNVGCQEHSIEDEMWSWSATKVGYCYGDRWCCFVSDGHFERALGLLCEKVEQAVKAGYLE
jgi:hypothetical protein